MRADKSKGMLRQVKIMVGSEGTREGFQSYRGGRLGLAVRTPDPTPLTPPDGRSPAPRMSQAESAHEEEGPLSFRYNQRRIV
jgi:hypothetical protein